jgi:hypothetical protein
MLLVTFMCACAQETSPVVQACQRWAECTNQPDTASEQCVRSELAVYEAGPVDCESKQDSVLLCFVNMPCNGWTSSDAEKTYCAARMSALASCK